jgi:hypothetical protein
MTRKENIKIAEQEPRLYPLPHQPAVYDQGYRAGEIKDFDKFSMSFDREFEKIRMDVSMDFIQEFAKKLDSKLNPALLNELSKHINPDKLQAVKAHFTKIDYRREMPTKVNMEHQDISKLPSFKDIV